MRRNLEDLNEIATSNGGNRAFGLPGYKASVDYVLERLQQPGFETLTSWVQPLNHTFSQVLSISVTGPDGEDEEVVALIYNPATPLPDGITAPLIDTPVDDERGEYFVLDPFIVAPLPSSEAPNNLLAHTHIRFRVLRRSVGGH